MNAPRQKRIGKILCEEGFITSHQLEHALIIQEAVKTKQIGQILLDLGYITEAKLNKAMAIQRKMKTAKTEALHHAQ